MELSWRRLLVERQGHDSVRRRTGYKDNERSEKKRKGRWVEKVRIAKERKEKKWKAKGE